MPDNTPPNWPIYGISLSALEIHSLVKCVFPSATLISMEDLPKGKSYNNRIYFVWIRSNDGPRDHEIVLKVIGRFFDTRKVHNEVASHLLLEKYCPNVPAPRVLAWSDGSHRISALRNGNYIALPDGEEEKVSSTTKSHPWIMLSRRPGRILTEDDMQGVQGDSIADQLADIFRSWRKDIPPRDQIGSLALQFADHKSKQSLCGVDTSITDPFYVESTPAQPITSLQQLYEFLLVDQIHMVNTKDVFTQFRSEVITMLQRFLKEIFPLLPCFTKSTLTKPEPSSVFTHQDFSPRNILVSETFTGLTVSAILDFEFSGFFPPEEEYLTCVGRQADDWPRDFMDKLLGKLDSRGVGVPKLEEGTSGFETLLQLSKVIEHAAPWWLQDGHVTGEELKTELDRAQEVIKYNLAKLIASVNDTSTPAGWTT